MKNLIKCEICNKVYADGCVFATRSKVIDGKKYTFCCPTALRKFMLNRAATDHEESAHEQK